MEDKSIFATPRRDLEAGLSRPRADPSRRSNDDQAPSRPAQAHSSQINMRNEGPSVLPSQDDQAGITTAVPPAPFTHPYPHPHDAHRSEDYIPHRSPPDIPVLAPEHRFCFREEFVKPYRAHHCRSCGTCVLKYDHHCPCKSLYIFFVK